MWGLELEVAMIQKVLHNLLHALLRRGLIAVDMDLRLFGGFVRSRNPCEFCMVSVHR